jgi:DNA-binding NarL/FixJ family response regulator
MSAVQPSPRVLLIDRQQLFLSAMSRLLTTAPLSAGVSVTTQSDEAVELLRQTPTDLVVCDVKAEPIPGPELAAMLAASYPDVRVILLADAEDTPLLVAALTCGAAGFFTKDTPLEEFLAGISAVLNGDYAVGRNLLQPVAAKLIDQAGNTPRDEERQLSASEREILVMVGQAQSIRTIATTRGVSQETVRNHLASVYRKLGLHNRTEAILWAARMGLTHPRTDSRD